MKRELLDIRQLVGYVLAKLQFRPKEVPQDLAMLHSHLEQDVGPCQVAQFREVDERRVLLDEALLIMLIGIQVMYVINIINGRK